jgi:hypothetical protein
MMSFSVMHMAFGGCGVLFTMCIMGWVEGRASGGGVGWGGGLGWGLLEITDCIVQNICICALTMEYNSINQTINQ